MTRGSTPQRVWVAWSSGKDSALTLARLIDDTDIEVVGLLTTFDDVTDRVPLHAVGRDLVRAQAEALQLPLHEVRLPHDSSEGQARALGEAVDTAKYSGVDAVAFGDIHLEWARERRQRSMTGTGVDAMFPLWGVSSSDLAVEVVDRSIDAIVVCVDTQVVPDSSLGCRYDHAFLATLAGSVDPCGENGEFHTFVTGHPSFSKPLAVHTGTADTDDRYASIRLALDVCTP